MERGVKGLALGALVIAVVGLTVAFATLSRTFTVTGSATVNASTNWNVRVKSATLEGTGITVDGTKLTTTDNSATLAVGGATFTKPGDSITATITVENAGTIKAKLANLAGDDKSAADLVCKDGDGEASTYCSSNMTYTVTTPEEGTELAANGTAVYTITLKLNDAATTLPEKDLTITMPTLTFDYVQA